MQFDQLRRRRQFMTLRGGVAARGARAAGRARAKHWRAHEHCPRSGRSGSDGLNVRIETRWGAGNIETIRKFAAELVALGLDVILVSGGTGAGPLLQLTRTVPVVFTQTPDPVGAALIA